METTHTYQNESIVGKTVLLNSGRGKRKVQVDSFDGTTFTVTDISDFKGKMTSFGRKAFYASEIEIIGQ